MPFDYAALKAELDSLGEEEVRARNRRDEYLTHNIRHRYVQDWLLSKDSARRDAREAETLSVAKDANTIALSAAVSASDANDIARLARKIAMVAAIAAIVAAIAAIKWR